MHWRLAQVLGDLVEQMPDNVKAVDLWRATVVNRGGFADDQTEVWVRMAENVYAFKMEKAEHWILTTAGKMMKPKGTYLLLADDYGLKPDDHIIMDGIPYIIDEEEANSGMQKLTLDKQGSRFVAPTRTTGLGGLAASLTYRELGMKARVA
jgi:hypothetical protein